MMNLSLYSFVMATLWFTAFILLGAFLQRKVGFLFCYQLAPLLFLLVLTVFRLAVPVEAPFTQVVCSTALYPIVQDFLRAPMLTLGGTTASVTHTLLGLWALVTLILCGRLVLHIRRDIRRLNALSALPCSHIKQALETRLSRKGGFKRVRLIVSPDISTPMLMGLFKPVILLPPECTDFSKAELNCILEHELTHLHSGDLWVKFIIRLLCCLMWWNPCVYFLQKNLDSMLEYKCDLTVTKGMPESGKIEYLQTLLNVLRLSQRRPAEQPQALQASFCGIAETAVLKRRFELVLDRPDKSKRPAAIAVMVVTVLLFIGSYSVIIQPASFPPAEDLEHEVLITPENSYILKTADGTYYLMYEGTQFGEISAKNLDIPPHCYLTIQTETTGG